MSFRSLQHQVALQAERAPEATAIVLGRERMSYGALRSYARRLARVLGAAGCRPGDRVCLFLPKAPQAIGAMLATLEVGAAYVPIDLGNPAARVARIVATCEPRCILASDEAEPLLREVLAAGAAPASVRLGWISGQAPADAAFGPKDIERASEARGGGSSGGDTAHILFTSGSTGQPKGVVITHDNVLAFVRFAIRQFGLGPDDRLSGHSPLCFDLSTFDIYGALTAGAELHLVPPALNLLAHKLAEFIRQSELTQWFSVPSALTYLARFEAVAHGDFPSLRRLLWCGDVLPTPVLGQLMRRLPHARFTNLYGPTEATIASSHYTVEAAPASDREPIPIGRACDGERLLVLDGDLQATPPGEVGQLYIAGAGLSPGYYRDPDKTQAAFVELERADKTVDRIYRTGDLARVDEAGLVWFVGRADTQIKSRGYRIELGEIEAAASAVEAVGECAVVALASDGFEGATICLAYTPRPGAELAHAELRTILSQHLPTYMLPTRWAKLEALPKNAHGKIDRPALKERFSEDAASPPR
jgi:amino acid adenylation domain-containing protein